MRGGSKYRAAQLVILGITVDLNGLQKKNKSPKYTANRTIEKKKAVENKLRLIKHRPVIGRISQNTRWQSKVCLQLQATETTEWK